MSKRHMIKPNDLELIIGRLEELVLANSGLDEFEEIFKLIIAKLFDEIYNPDCPEFVSADNFAITANHTNRLIYRAASQWPGIISNPPESNLNAEHIDVCVREIEKIRLLTTDLAALDAAFEYLVGKSSKGAKGQFFTPRHIIECCTRIIKPQIEERLIDPACGSGGFLIHGLNYMRNNSKEFDVKDICENNIWGFDFDPRAIRIAKALMLVATGYNTNLYNLNSLLTESINVSLSFNENISSSADPRMAIEDVMRSRFGPSFKGFNTIMTNPPFAGEIQEQTILNHYELSQKNRLMERDVLFIERCIGLLAPNGRLAIVLPHNKLAGTRWAYVREWLVRKAQIVAVLSLGRNSFLPHTHQKAGVIFARRRIRNERPNPKEKILFLINEKEGKDSKGKFIFREGASKRDGIWESIDHDFNEIVEMFDKHVTQESIAWGST